ncbi:DUF4403 family protein [Rufibacter ruber]|uniref:DUF4403 family protein n=1 Tax=Rufibacter ruber TaxID=1783499 RepID=UPI000831CD30|nr:DUF4403 family protein [Rufibacter ruber]
MRHRLLSSVVFWVGLVSLLLPAACQKSTSLSTTAPSAAVAQHPLPERRLSTINVPITIPVTLLEQVLNEQLTGVLYQDDNLEDDDLAVKVTKAAPIRLKAEFSKLYVEVPLRVKAKGRWQWNACELCKKLQKTEETEFDLVVKTESRLQVLPNYQLKSYTSGDFAWGERKPTLSLGPLTINLAKFIEPQLKAQLNPMLQQLDKELQQRVNLKAYLAEAWQQVQQPFSVHDGYKAWLTVEPKAVRITPLALQNNQLSLQIGIDALLAVSMGQKPALAALVPLPAFTPARTLPQEAQIQVATDLSYPYLTDMLQKELRNQTFSFEGGKHQFTVHDLVVSGSGRQLLLALDASGMAKTGFLTKKFQGKVYLQGTPYYDAATQSLKVKDLEYEVKTRDQLVNTANWLLQNKLKTQLEQQMAVPVKDQLSAMRQSLKTGLAENRLHERVLLRGTVLSFEPDTLFLTPSGVRTLFVASGKMALFVQ